MAADPVMDLQDTLLLLELATAICTLAGEWFAAQIWNAMVWLTLVIAASCGIAAAIVVALLPVSAGLHGQWIGAHALLLDIILVVIVSFAAIRVWMNNLSQVEFR